MARPGCGRIVGVVALLAIVLGVGVVAWLGARMAATPPATPIDAGREWFVTRNTAGTPDRTVDDGARILASWEVSADKRLVLYAWRPSATTPATALTVAPLGIQYRPTQLLPWWPRRGWHPAGTAGRRAALPQGDELYAGSMPAGFCGVEAPIAAAWGLSARGSRARITWSDGVITEVAFADGAFLVARHDPNYPSQLTQRLSVVHVEALGDAGIMLTAQDIPRSVFPEVRGPAQAGGPAVR